MVSQQILYDCFVEATAMLNVCVGLLFQFGITHIVIVDGGGNSCYCTDAPDIVFSQFALTL